MKTLQNMDKVTGSVYGEFDMQQARSFFVFGPGSNMSSRVAGMAVIHLGSLVFTGIHLGSLVFTGIHLGSLVWRLVLSERR